MAIDIMRLYGQGRAKSPNQLWTPEELDALLLLEREGGISRMAAADYIRNGITTLEDLKKAQESKFQPAKIDEVVDAAIAGMKGKGEVVRRGAKRKTK